MEWWQILVTLWSILFGCGLLCIVVAIAIDTVEERRFKRRVDESSLRDLYDAMKKKGII